MTVDKIKLTAKFVENTVDSKLLKSYMTLGHDSVILKKVLDGKNVQDLINNLFAALICLHEKGYMLEEQLEGLLKEKVTELNDIKDKDEEIKASQ